MVALAQEVAVVHVLITHLLATLGLRRSLRVRAVLDTTVMLRQGRAVPAQLADTRVSLRTVLTRPLYAMRVNLVLLMMRMAR